MKKIISFLVVVLALISLPPIMSIPLLIYIIAKSGIFNRIDWFEWDYWFGKK